MVAQRILFIRLSSLGDVLDATPVATAIKHFFPQAQLGWVVDQRCAPILCGNPYLDHLHVWEQSVMGSLRLARELRAMRYDVTLDAQGLFKSGIIARVAGARRRIGLSDAREWSPLFYSETLPGKTRYSRVSERALWLLQGIGIEANPENFDLYFPTDADDKQAADCFMDCNGLLSRQFAVHAPATTTLQRHWLLERWAELIDRLQESWGLRSVLVGGGSDRALVERIASLCRTNVPLSAGRLTLRACACLVRQAAVVVALDSFILHVGLAFGIPTVGLFGPTPVDRFEAEPDMIIVQKPYPCRPCGRRPSCDGAYTCMHMITVEDVLTAMGEKLRTRPSRYQNSCAHEAYHS